MAFRSLRFFHLLNAIHPHDHSKGIQIKITNSTSPFKPQTLINSTNNRSSPSTLIQHLSLKFELFLIHPVTFEYTPRTGHPLQTQSQQQLCMIANTYTPFRWLLHRSARPASMLFVPQTTSSSQILPSTQAQLSPISTTNPPPVSTPTNMTNSLPTPPVPPPASLTLPLPPL